MFESLQPVSYAITSCFFLLSATTILLRTYTRSYVIKSFGWDDWCMFGILFFNCGHLSILYYMLMNGGGLHIQTALATNAQWLVNLTYALFVEEIYYVWMHWVIKTAFLLFYLRFANTKSFRALVYCTMALNTMTAITTWLMYCLQCIPLDAYFHPAAHPTVKCLDRSILAFTPAAFNVFIDILIVVLPIRPLWKIQVSLRKRLMLISIVSLGAVVVLISSLRMIVLREFQKEEDVTYSLGKLIIISSIEIDVAIIAANGPSLKTFWARYISHTLKTNTGTRLSDFSSPAKRAVTSQASCQALDRADKLIRSVNDSAEELKMKDSGIIVTSSIGVERRSAESHERGHEWVPESYNHFGSV